VGKYGRQKNIIIICAGLHSKVLLEVIKHDESLNIIGYLDDNEALLRTQMNGHLILGPVTYLVTLLSEMKIDYAVIGFGNIKLRGARSKLYHSLKERNVRLLNVIHSSAYVSPDCLLCQGVYLGPMSVVHTNVRIGENVIIYTGSTIDHDSRVGNSVLISPGVTVAGQAIIEDNVYIGPGATVANGIKIGKNSVIGAGSTVLDLIPPNVLAYGCPAKVMKDIKDTEYKLP